MALSKIQSESIDLADNFAGMRFGGTASANAIDDYEEGTWTPTMEGVTTAGTLTGSAEGRYVKVGSYVYVEFRLENMGLSGAAGRLRITGLPFTTSMGTLGATGIATVTQMYNFNWTADHRQSFYPDSGGTVLNGLESRGGTTWTDWNVTNATNLYMNVVYMYQTTQ